MQSLRWGILGAAKIAREFVAPAIHLSNNGMLAAVASRDAERGEAFVAPFAGARVLTDYQALIDDPDIDAVYIPLPNHLHVEWTRRCLQAGKAVLCEKPIALEAAEIDALIAERDRAGVLAAEAFMVTHHPQWAHCRNLIAEGAIGKLHHIDGAFTYFNADPANIRNQLDLGGGALRDIGVYPVITARLVSGAEPQQVRAVIRTDPRDGTDTLSRVWCEFEDFALDFYVSTRLGLRQEMVFHGTDGWLRVAAPFNAGSYGEASVELGKPDGTRHLQRYPRVDHYVLQAEAFARSVHEGVPYACTLEYSRANQRVIDAIFASGERDGAAMPV